MKVVTKIALGFTALILLNALMGLWLMSAISEVNADVRRDMNKVHEDVLIAETALDLAFIFEKQVSSFKEGMLAANDRERLARIQREYDEAQSRTDERLEELVALVVNLGHAEDLEALLKPLKEIKRHHLRMSQVFRDALGRVTPENQAALAAEFAHIEDDQLARYAKIYTDANGFYDSSSSELLANQDVMAAKMSNLTLVLVGGGMLAGLLATIVCSVSINRGLKLVVDELSQFAAQTASASTQLSNAAQSLADGTSETAAALEETSASIEEISGQVRQNSTNTDSTAGLAQQARDTGEKGSQSIAELSKGIEQIKENADKTAKIVKTIDEIAFQTNILALNAAVEAARAGDAGKGFAVVAEEVRNLAQRASEAARSTAEIIEQSVHSAEAGVTLTQKVTQVVNEMTMASRKVNDLVGEVTASGREINNGITQIAKAVRQMDQTTQGNAASAEENSALGEEMARQADSLYHLVLSLESMVRNVDQATLNRVAAGGQGRRVLHRTQKVARNDAADHSRNGMGKQPSHEQVSSNGHRPSDAGAREAIPLPDDEEDTATLRRF